MRLTNLRRDRLFAPASLGQVLASTLLHLPDGTSPAAWFGGTREAHEDVAIWAVHGDLDGWTDPVCWAKVADVPHWNQMLYQDHDA